MTDPASPTVRQDPPTHDLLLLTTISALDGTLFLLAAAGTFADPAQALLAGLTVVAGAGAWLAARTAFPRGLDRPALRRLSRVALPAAGLAVAAAFAGTRLAAYPLVHLPRSAGVALLLVALQVGGLRLPRPLRLPLPAWSVIIGALAEGVARWIP